MPEQITQEKFKEILPLICDKETSQDPNGWSEKNPLWGHCAVVSLVAQNLFGGELLRASLTEVPGFEHMRSHYWNKLADGSTNDFTKPQFGNNYPTGLKAEVRERSYVLSYPETAKRYKLLSFRLAKILNGNNPIFDDPIYQKCFYAALDSPCQKLRFGCVITHNSEIVWSGQNKTIGPLKSFCDPTCIRLSIQSRTESMIGSCGHAEELGLWEVARMGIPLNECELYVAGINMQGMPLFKKEAGHTCLRCSVQMYNAGIKMVYGPMKEGWVMVTGEEAVKTAKLFATKEKTV